MAQTHDLGDQPTPRIVSGRGKAALAIDWWPRSLPRGTRITPITLIAHDGGVSRGTLYEPDGGSDVVFSLMHPRQDLSRHPLVPELLDRGHAVWTQASRTVGNDLTLVHETALLDVAAGVEFLRDHGFGRIYLIGHSGGAGLYSFYAEQSQKDPGERIARTPGGAPTPLREASLPAPDGLALIAPHPGQGRLLLAAIDPSVADAADPLSVIPELDPFDPRNGFAAPPESSHYSADFVAAYRAAQRERVARIDAHARELIARQQEARKRRKDGTGDRRDSRAAILTPAIATYRTDADLRCVDLALDPSDRPYGSVISSRPSVSNYGIGGFGRLATAEAWLSTWSGLSSNAAVERTLSGVTLPTIVIEFTGDTSVFPSDVQAALTASAAEDLEHVRIRADHFGRPLTEGDEPGLPQAAETLTTWIERR